MKKGELEKWLLDNDQTDSWYVSFGEDVSEEPYSLMEINRRALVSGNSEIYVLHSSKAHMDEPPWIGFEPSQETILKKAPPVKKLKKNKPIPLDEMGRLVKDQTPEQNTESSSGLTSKSRQSKTDINDEDSVGVIGFLFSKIFDLVKASLLMTILLFCGSIVLTNESLSFVLKLLYANLFLFVCFYSILLVFTTKRIRKNFNRWLVSA